MSIKYKGSWLRWIQMQLQMQLFSWWFSTYHIYHCTVSRSSWKYYQYMLLILTQIDIHKAETQLYPSFLISSYRLLLHYIMKVLVMKQLFFGDFTINMATTDPAGKLIWRFTQWFTLHLIDLSNVISRAVSLLLMPCFLSHNIMHPVLFTLHLKHVPSCSHRTVSWCSQGRITAATAL